MDILLAILPTIILGSYIYKKDIVEKEPKKLLVILFLCGFLSAITTLVLTAVVQSIFPIFSKNYESLDMISLMVYVFFGIALIEEFSKWIYIYAVCWNHKEFNYAYDAIVYAVFVSLGFATIENILYVLIGGSRIAFLRMFSAVPAHAFFGVLMGYYLALSKLSHIHNFHEKSKVYKIRSLFVPATCHFIYDYLAFAGLDALFYIFIIFLYIYALSKVKRLSKVTKGLFNSEGEVYGKFGVNKT